MSKTATLLLAHGAGAGMDSDFLVDISERLKALGVTVVRFNFPYMARAVAEGRRRPPDRAPVLLQAFRDEVEKIKDGALQGPLILGGKSMGGRMASMLLAEDPDIADGLAVLGYPFHAPGKPEKLRTDHFPGIKAPGVIIQGSRDAFGNRDLIETLDIPPNLTVAWAEDGNHDLKPRKSSGLTHEDNLALAAGHIKALADSLTG